MKTARIILSCLLAFTLYSSLPWSIAYANPAGGTALEDPVENEGSEFTAVNPADGTALEDSAENEGSEFTAVNPADCIEYVYLDEKVIALDEEVHLAFGLLDNEAVISSAQLVLSKIDTDETCLFESTAVFENAALFSLTFTELSDASAYTIQSICYSLIDSDTNYQVVFNEEDADGYTDFRFDVITKELREALSGDNGDSEFTALVIDSDGELIATSSIEEALEYAAEVSNELLSGDELSMFSIQSAASDIVPTATTSAREDYLIIALDPGHGANDPGAVSGSLREADLNWPIALAMRDELLTYTGVSVFLTRAQNENPGLQKRVDNAVAVGADVVISLHVNAGGGTGSEVWIPNNSSYLYNETHIVGSQLGTRILEQLAGLGLANRGLKTGAYGGATYPDGSISDYFTIISASRNAGIPGIIIEHAFLDNSNDAAKLTNPAFLAQLGIADATGVARYYNLEKDTTAHGIAFLQYQAYLTNIGWLSSVYDQKIAGANRNGFAMGALKVQLLNIPSGQSGDIQVQVNTDSTGWQGWRNGGQEVGSTGQSKPIQALQIRLTGSMANAYDVYYRSKVTKSGWLGWTCNGASSGSISLDYAIEAVQITLVVKGSGAPGSTDNPFIGTTTSTLLYRAHVSYVGWQESVTSNSSSFAGTTGLSLRMEALTISFSDQEYSGGIEYNAHLAYIGWQGWRSTAQMSGTTGQSRQMEAIIIRLTGEMAKQYDLYYRVHVQNFGWLDWARSGAPAGSAGYGYRMEALQIQLVKKGGGVPPSNTSYPYRQTGTTVSIPSTSLMYQAHVADIGWQDSVSQGSTAGTTGLSKRIEALILSLESTECSGSIEYNSHLAYIGWQGWKTNGSVSGTTGQSRQMEAVRINLTGELAEQYDLYYRVHSQNYGWLDWASNGAPAGTVGYSYRLEAIQIKLVKKGGAAPGSTTTPYREYSPAGTSTIMGASQTTVAQMVAYFNSTSRQYPSSVYTQYGAATITDWCRILLEEANREGVRAEVVFCQAMKETGWLQFGGQVSVGQCNFGGLGATNGGAAGADFSGNGVNAVRIGLRAQVQHLKGYATTIPASQFASPIESPRFYLLEQLGYRGIAPTLEGLNGRWAVPGTTYGQDLQKMIDTLFAFPK